MLDYIIFAVVVVIFFGILCIFLAWYCMVGMIVGRLVGKLYEEPERGKRKRRRKRRGLVDKLHEGLVTTTRNERRPSWSTSSVENSATDVIDIVTKKLPSEVKITDGDITDRSYKIIVEVSATVNKKTIFSANPTKEMVNDKLREKGAELGVNAIILVRYREAGISFFSWRSLEGTGQAIIILS